VRGVEPVSTLNGTQARTVPVWQGRVRMRVLSKGAGPNLVFFHGPWGLHWTPFLDALAQHFTVHAPEHPGTSPGANDDIYNLDGLWDLILCYDELLEGLSLDGAAFVGHSFGAMVACELAAAYPRRAGRLALIDPIGLWRDDAPVTNWMMLDPKELPGHVFRDSTSAGAKLLFAQPEDDAARVAAQVGLTWAMGATGKFIWPIPDKGLKKRIHRVKAPTLLIWGEQDRFLDRALAQQSIDRCDQGRVEYLPGASHWVHHEKPDRVAKLILDFFA